MTADEKNEGPVLDSKSTAMMHIVRDHKVFWTSLQIELVGDQGRPLKVDKSVALVGTDADNKMPGDESGEPTVFDKLFKMANWLTISYNPGVLFEIRRHDNIVFYIPDSLRTNRKENVVVIWVLRSDIIDRAISKEQLQKTKEIETRLEDLGCPKDPWRERPATI